MSSTAACHLQPVCLALLLVGACSPNDSVSAPWEAGAEGAPPLLVPGPDAGVDGFPLTDSGTTPDHSASWDGGAGPVDVGAGQGSCNWSTTPSTSPMVLYYGYLRDNQGAIDETMNKRLVKAGLDVVFTAINSTSVNAGDHLTCGKKQPPTPLFTKFKSWGARLAYGIKDEDLVCCLTGSKCNGKPSICGGTGVQRTADFLENLFKDGWDYVSVDELAADSYWPDGKSANTALRKVMVELDKRNQGKKLILWFSPPTVQIWQPASTKGTLASFAGLFKDCQTLCRKLVFESYYSLSMSASQRLSTKTAVLNNRAFWLNNLAQRLSSVASGTNNVSVAGLGVCHDYLDYGPCDLAPFKPATGCPSGAGPSSHQGKGGLWRQFAVMHGQSPAKYWQGVAFYSLGRVSNKPGYWTTDDVSQYLAQLTKWWAINP